MDSLIQITKMITAYVLMPVWVLTHWRNYLFSFFEILELCNL